MVKRPGEYAVSQSLFDYLNKLSSPTTIINRANFKRESAEISSLAQFFDQVIEPRLILDTNVIKGWHDFLMDYCHRNGVTYFVRSGASPGTLRRGWLCRYKHKDESFNIMFVSNDMASIVYKLCLDGYHPGLDQNNELLRALTEPVPFSNFEWNATKPGRTEPIRDAINGDRSFIQFPVHASSFGGSKKPDDKLEGFRNVGFLSFNSSCIKALGCKHSHILDAGDGYPVLENGQEVLLGISGIVKKYFSFGKPSNYVWDSQLRNYVYDDVPFDDPDDNFGIMRELAIASTFRLLDPINHFLAPKEGDNLYEKKKGEIEKDVAEYPALTSYVGLYNQRRLSAEWDEFLEEALSRRQFQDNSADPFRIMYIINTNAGGNIKTPKLKSIKSKKQPSPRTSKSSIKLSFIPADINAFKAALLQSKKATIEWRYSDGRSVVTPWDASRFATTSSVRGNIQSKSQWKSGEIEGLIEVIATVI